MRKCKIKVEEELLDKTGQMELFSMEQDLPDDLGEFLKDIQDVMQKHSVE